MKRRFKVLPLPAWAGASRHPIFERSFLACVENSEVIAPVFNRDGFYLDRQTGRAWIERHGKAWAYQDRKNFQWELDNSPGNNRLHPRVYDAIKVLVDEGIAGPKLGHLFTVENFARYCQRSRFGGLRSRMRLKKFIASKCVGGTTEHPA